MLMRSKEARAFDVSLELAASRAAYGGTQFGDGCLLARRLVETGIPFVEVFQGGWDTHANNFPQVKKLSQEVDPAMSTLINDLKDRSEEHTSELQSPDHLVCRLLLEKKNETVDPLLCKRAVPASAHTTS